MGGFIDAANLDPVCGNVDFIDAAGVLGENPVRGEGKVSQLNEQRPVDAVMPDHHHGLIRVSCKHETQRVRRSRGQFLQRAVQEL